MAAAVATKEIVVVMIVVKVMTMMEQKHTTDIPAGFLYCVDG